MPFARRRFASRAGRGRFRGRGASSAAAHGGGNPSPALDRAALAPAFSDDLPPTDSILPVAQIPNCPRHDLPAISLVCRRGRNAGRRFFKCSRPRATQCDFFQWADETTQSCPHIDDDPSDITPGQHDPPITPAPPVVDSETSPDDALTQLLEHSAFRPGQREALEILLAGRSALAVLPTAAGKSVIYQLFAALRPGLVIVVTPLVALMRSAALALPSMLPSAILSAGMSRDEMTSVISQARSGQLKALFVAPERLATSSFRTLFSHKGAPVVSLVVVDEAHCVAAWSHNFRVAYLRLPTLLRGHGASPLFSGDCESSPPVLALTATATREARRDICTRFGIEEEDVVTVPAMREDISLTLSSVASGLDAKASELVRRLRAEPFASMLAIRRTMNKKSVPLTSKNEEEDGDKDEVVQSQKIQPSGKKRKRPDADEEYGWRANTRLTKRASSTGSKRGKTTTFQTATAGGDRRSVIVYVTRQRDCTSVSNYITAAGLGMWGGVAAYHAGLETGERLATQTRFERGEIAVLVATVAFGMGVSYDVVGGVLHFDPPGSIDALAQETGRAARDGRPGFAHLLFCEDDVLRLRSRCHADGVDVGAVRAAVRRLVDSRVRLRDVGKDSVLNHGAEKDGEDDKRHDDDENDCRPYVMTLAEDELRTTLDLKFETGETIAAELEAALPGVTVETQAYDMVTLQFFTETPTALADSTTSSLSTHDCSMLSAILQNARVKSGRYSAQLSKLGLTARLVAPTLTRLRIGGHAKIQPGTPVVQLVCASDAMRELQADTRRWGDVVYEKLGRSERQRRKAADALVDIIRQADAQPCDAAQSRFLRMGIAEHFEREIEKKNENESITSACVSNEERDMEIENHMAEGRMKEMRRMCRSVLDERGCGKMTAVTGRQVARVLHGLDGSRLRAKEWWRCGAWGRFVDIEFDTIARVANEEVRARLCNRPRRERE